MQDQIDDAVAILDDARASYDHGLVFCGFSGGHDSLVATHVAMEYGGADAVVHINTGIGIPRTRRFVRDVCRRFGWPMLEYKARENTKSDGTPDPQRYEDLVLERGFPGPGMHWLFYSRLKERQLERLSRDFRTGPDDHPLIATGRRKYESGRRMKLDEPHESRERETWSWVNPIFRWREPDLDEYMERHDLPKNPVVDKICMSGECLCGAFARDGELAEIGCADPEVMDWLLELEERVDAAGFPWGWEDEPPEWFAEVCRGQQQLPGAEADDYRPALCHGCMGTAEQDIERPDPDPVS